MNFPTPLVTPRLQTRQDDESTTTPSHPKGAQITGNFLISRTFRGILTFVPGIIIGVIFIIATFAFLVDRIRRSSTLTGPVCPRSPRQVYEQVFLPTRYERPTVLSTSPNYDRSGSTLRPPPPAYSPPEVGVRVASDGMESGGTAEVRRYGEERGGSNV